MQKCKECERYLTLPVKGHPVPEHDENDNLIGFWLECPCGTLTLVVRESAGEALSF